MTRLEPFASQCTEEVPNVLKMRIFMADRVLLQDSCLKGTEDKDRIDMLVVYSVFAYPRIQLNCIVHAKCARKLTSPITNVIILRLDRPGRISARVPDNVSVASRGP